MKKGILSEIERLAKRQNDRHKQLERIVDSQTNMLVAFPIITSVALILGVLISKIDLI